MGVIVRGKAGLRYGGNREGARIAQAVSACLDDILGKLCVQRVCREADSAVPFLRLRVLVLQPGAGAAQNVVPPPGPRTNIKERK